MLMASASSVAYNSSRCGGSRHLVSWSTSSINSSTLHRQHLLTFSRHHPRHQSYYPVGRRHTSSTASTPISSSSRVSDDDEFGTRDPTRFWHYDPLTGRSQRPIFVAATKQHVGKTTTCLALLSGLKKRFDKVGFLKPVGQQHVEVESGQGDDKTTLRVDKVRCCLGQWTHKADQMAIFSPWCVFYPSLSFASFCVGRRVDA